MREHDSIMDTVPKRWSGGIVAVSSVYRKQLSQLSDLKHSIASSKVC